MRLKDLIDEDVIKALAEIKEEMTQGNPMEVIDSFDTKIQTNDEFLKMYVSVKKARNQIKIGLHKEAFILCQEVKRRL